MSESTERAAGAPAPALAPPGLTRRVAFGMVTGAALGLLLNAAGGVGDGLLHRWLVDGALRVVGALFVASLKLLVVPIVFVSLARGTAAVGDLRGLGRIGVVTMGLYVATTALAVTLAIVAGLVLQPGAGFELSTPAQFVPRPPPSLADVVIGLVPTNPIQAMAEGNVLQVIVFAGLFGVALLLAGEAGSAILRALDALQDVFMRMVMLLLLAAPVGVFALLARVFAQQGLAALRPLALYMIAVLLVLLVHTGVVYSTLVRAFAGMSPLFFFRRIRGMAAVAFSTASSNATLPVTLETVERELGVDNAVASFTIPLGATINMDGTAIMQGVATLFIAQAYGLHLSVGDLVSVVLTATLASIGTAGVPGVGLIMLAMVLQQVGLPVEGIGLVLGVDRILDMARTAVNVTGDAAVTCVVARREGRLSPPVA
jgi:Na+/H+-dicarboxylate symporter